MWSAVSTMEATGTQIGEETEGRIERCVDCVFVSGGAGAARLQADLSLDLVAVTTVGR